MEIPGRRQLVIRAKERELRKQGWGPLRTYPAARADGGPLVFQLRLPRGIELVDLGALVDSAPGAPELARRGAAALQRVREKTPVVLMGALRREQADAPGEVLGTLTVSLPDLPWPPELEEGDEHDPDGRLVANTEVTEMTEKAIRVKRMAAEPQGDGREPLPVLMLQYLIQTRYGPLSLAFSTTHADMFGDWGRWLFQEIMLTAYLGEEPAPY